MGKTSEVLSEPEYKPRGAHKKSRNGCTRCKQQRKKCDELTPRCSRCTERNLCCQYPKNKSKLGDPTNEQSSDPLLRPDDIQRHLQSLPMSNLSYSTPITESLQSASSASTFESPSPLPSLSEGEELHTSLQAADILDSGELELLSHYLTHTIRTIPFDGEDLYALQPLMNSIVALAAACKCHDIIERPGNPLQNRTQIRELLALADQHYRASLRQIQAEISVTNHYDHVLANAALMVLYGSASHCIRIRLTEAPNEDGPLPSEFAPMQSQWISLIRAVHVAYIGLLNDEPEFVDGNQETAETMETPPKSSLPNEDLSLEDGPTKETRQLLLPILAATSDAALQKLRAKAQTIEVVETTDAPSTGEDESGNRQQLVISYSTGIQACFASLEILDGVVVEVFSINDDSLTNSSCSDRFAFGLDFPPLGRLSKLSPWLRSYLARVTSVTPSRPLRRTIMAFINRVPTEYLNLILKTLDLISMRTGRDGREPWENRDAEFLQPTTVHLLAMDIFAHWLVLVMLLDGVWWIGGIGAWELGRVVNFMQHRDWIDFPADMGQDWWPESIYKIRRELGKHMNAG
ncbi:hypothetical protein K469DRAFT_734889 [Zopfia rhizophila CBS 207.26]|uniref:Zn(2)-C6 fungal-type domain-containing protein n=1 Tax=Zopfia rhizophila CBS 207.26 TaxID=1314779 RepID=A0A6A6ENA3_9PEZI|nr:hypothetical protein K469DRAFT_734889 [Zopfia rhizophila CBS 207.26]